MLLSFCSEMGFSSVVLVGHDDGGLLALMAAKRVQSSLNPFNVSIPYWIPINRHRKIIDDAVCCSLPYTFGEIVLLGSIIFKTDGYFHMYLITVLSFVVLSFVHHPDYS